MWRRYGLALFSVFSWASAPIIFKSLVRDLEFESALFFFFIFGAGAMFFYLSMKRNWLLTSLLDNLDKWSILSLLLCPFVVSIHYLAYCYALSRIEASVAIALGKLSAIFQIVFAVLILKEKMKWQVWLIFLLGFIGMSSILLKGNFSSLKTIDVTFLFAILAGFLWALFLILCIKSKSNLSLPFMVGWSLGIGFLLIGFHLLVSGKGFSLPNEWQWLWLIYLGVVPTAIGVVTWVKATTEGVSRVANLEYLVPVGGVLLARLIFKETLTPHLILGLAFILGGAIYNETLGDSGK